jgi:hypothetical protein
MSFFEQIEEVQRVALAGLPVVKKSPAQVESSTNQEH